jgi:nitrate reductase gamma subunit
MDYYELVRGPFAWAALLIFIIGSLYRIVVLLVRGKKEKTLYPLRSVKDAVRSILHGVIPFGANYMRNQPVFTIVTFVFHICALILPIFLLAHIVLWYESWKILWWSIPDSLADTMAIMVILSCLYFFVRRLVKPEVRKVTRLGDHILLFVILLPFVTGFLAYHQWGPYRPILILHILSGELLLVSIPFSKLVHMVMFVFSRAYMGSEFGKVLESREW